MPDLTTASAMFLIKSSLTLHANLFHEFHPMGGVGARLADGAGFACAQTSANSATQKNAVAKKCFVFMQTFYQKRPEIGTGERQTAGASLEPYTMPGW